MAILADRNTLAIVQGATGREGLDKLRLMLDYGTRVVAGVTPGRGGQTAMGLPVYDTVDEAVERHPGVLASVIFVPAQRAKEAALEAIDAGIKLVVLCSERVPQQDMLEVIAYSRERDMHVIGPNTIGICSPGECLLGMISGRIDAARRLFRPGPVAVLSRSGSGAQGIPYYLSQAGIGQSTVLSVGGDPFPGTTWAELFPHLECDPQTLLVVGFGEIGGVVEEEAAEALAARKLTKPFVAYIAGHSAVSGVRLGHAGALMLGNRGSALAKEEALRAAGAVIVKSLPDIAGVVREQLQ